MQIFTREDSEGFQHQRGSVSIFLLILFIALLVFNLVLLDLARIYVAKQQTEALLKNGLRSTFAHFDQELYEKFGLLGLPEPNALYYFQHHLMENHRHEGLISLELVEVGSFQLTDSLANRDIFARQVMERMKYQAPLQLSLEILSFLTPFELELSDKVNQLETVHDVQVWYDKRLEQIERLQAQLETMVRLANEGEAAIIQLEEQYDATESEMSQLSSELGALAGENDPELLKKAAALQASISQLQNSLESIKEAAQSTINEYIRQIKDLFQQAQAAILDMAHANEMMQAMLDEHQVKNVYQVEDIIGLDDRSLKEGHVIEGHHPSEVDHEHVDWLERTEEIIFPNSLFEQLHQLMEDFARDLTQIEQPSYEQGGFDWGRLKQTLSSLAARVEILEQDISTYLQATLEEKEQLMELKDEYEEEGQLVLSQLKELLNEFIPAKSSQDEYIHTLTRLYATAGEEDLGESTQVPEPSLSTIVEMASGMLETLFTTLNSQQEVLGESVYVNEYMFAHFAAADPQDISSLLAGASEQSMGLDQQAIEYIIYGHPSPALNLARGLAELYILRALLNIPDAIRMCRATLHPLAMLACSVSRMLALAYQDMQLLLQGLNVKIHRFMASYEQHLKLLNYLHLQPGKVSRIQALVHFHLEHALFNFYTRVDASLLTTMPLYILPDKIQLLDSSSPWHEYELGYMLSRDATYAY